MDDAKPNCWEVMHCGREPGGARTGEMGVCPAAIPAAGSPTGANGGRSAGRICWSVAGTLCGDRVQGSFASKLASCTTCRFFQSVQEQEGPSFALLLPRQAPYHEALEQFVSVASVIDAMNAIVYVADMHTYELLFANSYAVRLFGQDLVGKRCWQVLQANQAGPCGFCTNRRLLDADGRPSPPVVWEFQNTVSRRWFLCIDRAIRWSDGRLVRMEVAVDITDRKEAEQFRQDYVALVTHDLRSPLSAMVMHAELIRRRLEAKGLAQEAEGVRTLLQSAKRMEKLIADLLDTARLEGGRIDLDRRQVDLRPWAATVIDHLPQATERARVELRAGPEPVEVIADPDRLERVLGNLLSNALKYSDGAPVVVAVGRRGNDAVITVSDQGVGLAADDLPRLFQRFYRASTHGRVQGLGLGLYDARLLVEAHGGRIWVESQQGRGSDFHVALPLAPTPAAA